MKLAIASMVSLLSAATLSAGSLVVNGGFETGDFSGWTLSGNTGNTGVDTDDAHSGTYGAGFGAVGSDSYLSQTVSTVLGTSYTLDYWLRDDGGSYSEFSVAWNGTLLTSFVNGSGFPYQEFTFANLVGTGSDTLTFSLRQDPAWFSLDDVSLAPSSVPEPATFGLIGVVLAGFGLLCKKIRH